MANDKTRTKRAPRRERVNLQVSGAPEADVQTKELRGLCLDRDFLRSGGTSFYFYPTQRNYLNVPNIPAT